LAPEVRRLPSSATNAWIAALAVQADLKILAAAEAGSTGKKGFANQGAYLLRCLVE